jgi:hypothetical protein
MVDARLDPELVTPSRTGFEWPWNKGRTDYWYVNQKLMQSGPEIHTYADRWGDVRGRHIYANEARRAYLNLGRAQPGVFVDAAAALGVDDPDNSRGVLLQDLDGDGDLDLLVSNQHGPVSVYRNGRRGAGGPHFVAVELEGPKGNAEAVGAVVTVTASVDGAPLAQRREVQLMGGFSAQAGRRLTFGLGQAAPPRRTGSGSIGSTASQRRGEPERLPDAQAPTRPRHRTSAGRFAPPLRGAEVSRRASRDEARRGREAQVPMRSMRRTSSRRNCRTAAARASGVS